MLDAHRLPLASRTPILMVVSLAACSGDPGVRASRGASLDAPRGGVAMVPPTSPTVDAAAQSAASAGAEPTPAATERLVVLDQVISSAPLFSDELAGLEDSAVAALEKVPGTHVVPQKEVRRIEALVAAGRAREGGPKCARAPKKGTLLERRYPDAVGATLWASCFSDSNCSTQIDVHTTLLPEGGYDDRFVAFRMFGTVADPLDLGAWKRALDGSAASPEAATHEAGMGGVGFGFGMGSGPPEVKLVDAQFGFTPKLTAQDVPAKLFRSCKSETTKLVVELDDKDVTRCEPSGCACTALAHRALGAGSSHRRAVLTLAGSGSLGTIGHGGGGRLGRLKGPHKARPFVRIFSSETMATRSFEHSFAMGQCLREDTPGGDLRVSFTLTASGRVSEIAIPESTFLDDTEKRCIAKELKTFEFTCPPEGSTTLTVKLHVELPKPP